MEALKKKREEQLGINPNSQSKTTVQKEQLIFGKCHDCHFGKRKKCIGIPGAPCDEFINEKT